MYSSDTVVAELEMAEDELAELYFTGRERVIQLIRDEIDRLEAAKGIPKAEVPDK
jgi:uncharacterized small protein (DUF1192 family)